MNESLQNSVLSINSAFAVLLTEYIQPYVIQKEYIFTICFPKHFFTQTPAS